MVAARRLGAMPAVAAVALVCLGQKVTLGQPGRTGEVVERLEELEEDGVLSVRDRTPHQVLQGLLSAALAHNLTYRKAVEMMNRNIESGHASVETYIDTWSRALSKALDRAEQRRTIRRQERRAEKQQAKEAKRAAKAAERQEELRQASIAQPLSATGLKLPPDKPYAHDGQAVLTAVRDGNVKKVLFMCDDPTVASSDSLGMKRSKGSTSGRQTSADVDFIPTDDNPEFLGGPAIHIATARGDSAMLSALLNKSGCGADVDLFNPRTGYTPLHLAVAQDAPAMVRLLIESGANLDIRSREAGMTALHLAVTRAATLPGAVMSLQQPGESDGRSDGSDNAKLSDSLRDGCVHLLLAAGASTELEDHRKLYTPLHMAAGYGSPEVAHLLLRFGASLKAEDESGQTAAQLALHRNHQYPRRPQVLELLQVQANSETLTLTGAWLSSHGLGGLARRFEASVRHQPLSPFSYRTSDNCSSNSVLGLTLFRDVLALSLTELGERVGLRKKQRRKLANLLTKHIAITGEAAEL